MTTITNIAQNVNNMNALQDAVFTTIQSTPRLQEMMFESLFFLASAHLGRTKRKELHGINAKIWGYMDAKEDYAKAQIDFVIRDGGMIIPAQGKINNKQTVTVRAVCGYNPTAISEAFKEINDNDGTHYSLYELANNAAPILATFLQDYWEDMLTYAIHHTQYHRNWQSFTPAASA